MSSFEKIYEYGMVYIMKTQTNDTKSLLTIIAAVIIIPIILVNVLSRMPGKYDKLAQCITDSGAKFYGAFWCPHCQAQKRAFGRSEKLLPYIECSTPDGKGRLEACNEAAIEGYPTWVFADGSRKSGEVAIKTLAEKTSCTQTLP